MQWFLGHAPHKNVYNLFLSWSATETVHHSLSSYHIDCTKTKMGKVQLHSKKKHVFPVIIFIFNSQYYFMKSWLLRNQSSLPASELQEEPLLVGNKFRNLLQAELCEIYTTKQAHSSVYRTRVITDCKSLKWVKAVDKMQLDVHYILV